MAADFKTVGEAALAMAHILLPQWLGGGPKGHEWLGARKSNGGLGDSWSVNLTTGAFAHFGGDEKGGDLISLYAALNHLDQGTALRDVAQLVGVSEHPVPLLPAKKPPERAAEPIPEGVSHPSPHPEYGAPTAIYRYGRAFWVLRYDAPDGKQFRPFTWRGGRWTAKAYPDPKPLYHLEQLKARPNAPILVVEGEKCADAAARILTAYVVLTWAGGAQAVRKTDWKPLNGRNIIVWPDADEPGKKAAAVIAEILTGEVERLRIVAPPATQPEGWDIADAIAEGWDANRLVKWAGEYVREPAAIPVAQEQAPAEGSAFVSWQSLGLDTNEGGMPHATLANASLILQMHPDFQGRIWLDSFRGQVYHTLRGPTPQPWTDLDSRRVTARVQQQLHIPKLSLNLMHEAILHAAECHARHSLTDWLDALVWDEEPRLDTWLSDCLGVERNEYSTAIARNWPIAMVARAYQPGVKMDTMPVLEGAMGLSKSTFLEVMGDPWFKAIPTAFGDKDFLQAIQGAWLVEIPDMTGFSRREHTHILAITAIRRDVYRASYGRFVEEHPRVAMFAGTSETDDYLQDARGRRRYWPLRCTEIDIDTLRAQREQIFAEAVRCYRHGDSWWKMPGVADAEQFERAAPDLWTDRVLDYCDSLWEETHRQNMRPVPITSARILADAIELPLAKQTDVEKKRIARIMRENGWIQSRDASRRTWKKVVRPPDAPAT
jgi:putative DNA primase/helicase